MKFALSLEIRSYTIKAGADLNLERRAFYASLNLCGRCYFIQRWRAQGVRNVFAISRVGAMVWSAGRLAV